MVDENGINYIIDGGFEEVTVAGGGDSTVDYEKYETVILSCSDFQNQSGSEAGARTVTNIIDSIESSGLDGADAFFCCGDYANTYNETERSGGSVSNRMNQQVDENDQRRKRIILTEKGKQASKLLTGFHNLLAIQIVVEALQCDLAIQAVRIRILTNGNKGFCIFQSILFLNFSFLRRVNKKLIKLCYSN